MDSSALQKRSALALGGLLALTACAGSMQAANALKITQGGTTITTLALACNTQTGTNPVTIQVVGIAAPASGHVYNVTISTALGHGIIVTPPASAQITSANTPLTYTISDPAGCVGQTTASGMSLVFSNQLDSGSVTADASLTAVSNTVTSPTPLASGLVASGVTVSCALSGGVYTPGPAQPVYVTSTATGGIPFTVTSTASLTLGGASGGTAGVTPVMFTVAAPTLCGSYSLGSSHTVNLHLASTFGAPVPDLVIPITITIVGPSTLTVTPVPAAPSVSLSYVKGSGVAGTANVSVAVASGPAVFFTVNTATLPVWLTVNTTSGTTSAPLSFSTTSASDSLAPGSYTATVYLKVAGQADFAVPVTLLLTNKAPKLLVNPGSATPNQISINWTLGTAAPTASITAASSDTPIGYTITTGGTLAPVVANTSGLAYNFGTAVPVTFNPSVFTTAQAGQILTGTVTFTWGNPAATTVVTFSVTVVSAGSTITGISPATLPTAAPGTVFTVVLTGSGFIGGTDPTLKTKIGLAAGGPPASITADSNFAISVTDSSHITLTITVPTIADPNLNFAPGGTAGIIGGTVNIGVCNGYSSGVPCTVATGTAAFTIGNGPLIQGVSSASSFQEVSPGTLPTIAPYDMISIFGSSFCSAGNSVYATTYNCGTTTLLSAAPSATYLVYPTTLTNEPATIGGVANTQQRFMSVSFYTAGGEAGAAIATAPLLFGTNGQINAIVPAALGTHTGAGAVDIVVNFGYGSYGSATLLSSAPFNVNVAAADPGVFTIGSDGQGSAAALAPGTYSLISNTNPTGARTGGHTANDGDIVQIYVTGLGAPNSTASIAASGSFRYPTDCVSATGANSYSTALQALGYVPATIDGAVIQSAQLGTGNYPPCMTTAPVVKIGGVAATVKYAGFVDDSIAGLYQINVLMPNSSSTFFPNWTPATPGSSISALTQPTALPVHVQVGSAWSQNNVTMWVAPRLLMVPGGGITPSTVIPNKGTANATVGAAYTGGGVTAFEGTGSPTYAITSGVLPAGLVLHAGTGVIDGTPGPGTGGTYAVTITATDTAVIPVTGTYSITFTVSGALVMSMTGTSPFADSPYGTVAPTAVTTITATGGTIPYTYAISSSPAPAGFSVNATTGAVTTSAAALAGAYTTFAVTATDSSSTPLMGTAIFEVDVPLALTTVVSPTPQTAGGAGVLYQAQASGNSGTVVYTLNQISTSSTGTLAIDASTGEVTPGTGTAGNFTFTVTATDSVTHASGASGFGTATTTTIAVTVN